MSLPAFDCFFGRMGGSGETARATRTILTVGAKLNSRASITATTGMITNTARIERARRPGRRTTYSRSSSVAFRPNPKTMLRTLTCNVSTTICLRSTSMTSDPRPTTPRLAIRTADYTRAQRQFGMALSPERWSCRRYPLVTLGLGVPERAQAPF